jgi:hypothetical protein
MPRLPTGPYKAFGRWVIALSELYDVSLSALAQKGGIDETTLSKSVKEGAPGPSLSTVEQVWSAFEELTPDAIIRKSLPVAKDRFYNAAGFATPEQQAYAELHLLGLEHFARDEKREQEREERIQELEKEIEQLRRRRPRSS